MKKKYLLLLVIIVLIGQFTFAVDDEDDIDKQEELLEEVEGLLDALDADHLDFVNQKNAVIRNIRALEQEIRLTEAEIEVLDGKIEENKKLVALAVIELDAAEAALQATNDLLDKRIRVMYKNGSIGYLEVLLESKNFEDLLVRVDMLQRIVQSDTDLIVQMEEDKKNVELKKAGLEEEQAKLLALQEEMDAQVVKLEGQVANLELEKIELLKNIEAVQIQIDQTEKDAEEIRQIIKDLEILAQYKGGKMTWPVPGHKVISSPFGPRIHPITGRYEIHKGIDVPVPTGTPVVAAQGGTVTRANWLGGYGKCVIINHGGGIFTIYAHNSKLEVEAGQVVEQGQTIALSGNTGNSTGAHVHFEVVVEGEAVDPLVEWLNAE